jgi:hypothetical protein
MTTAADDSTVEDAFEACLRGRPVADEGAGLAAFAGAVRAAATRPGRPNAALAELLATGLLTDQPSPSTRTARSAGSPPSRGVPRIRRRRRFAMLFPVLLAKFLSAGALAQAATGAGVVLVAVTGVGAAGALPDPLQTTVAAAVERVTPFELPAGEKAVREEEPAVDQPPAVEEPLAEEVPVDEQPAIEGADVAFDPEEWALDGPEQGQTFGSWVREAAHHGGVDGRIVRTWAHRKGLGAEELAAEGVSLDEPTVVPADPAPEVEAEVAAEPEGAQPESATTPRRNGGAAGGKGNGGDKATGGNKIGGGGDGPATGGGTGKPSGGGNGRN